jgi:hypothetical protein
MSESGQNAKYSLRADMVRVAPESGLKADIAGGPFRATNRHMRPQINPAGAKPGPDDALGRFFPIASPRDPAAHARLLALRGAETNFRVRNCRRFHLKALDHLVLLIVFLLRR